MRPKTRTQEQLGSIGKLVDITQTEIRSLLRQKKLGMVLFAIAYIVSFIVSGGPIPQMYMAVSPHDFSWPWRLF